nr:MAG TPA: hypothetical protein [Caudoviricetes sp.]
MRRKATTIRDNRTNKRQTRRRPQTPATACQTPTRGHHGGNQANETPITERTG